MENLKNEIVSLVNKKGYDIYSSYKWFMIDYDGDYVNLDEASLIIMETKNMAIRLEEGNVVLATTYSGREINNKFLHEMYKLLDLKMDIENAINDYRGGKEC